MLCLKPGWVPALAGILLATGSILAYVISVLKKDVTPLLPFISEAGGYLPQSGIFSIFMILTSFTSIVAIYIRFLVVKDLLIDISGRLLITNIVALAVGTTSSLGLLVVAAYPITTIEVAHDVGAYTAFLLAVTYSFLQTYLTYKLYPEFNGIAICRIRLLISCLSLASVIVMVVFYIKAQSDWSMSKNVRLRAKRIPGDKGYLEFLVAASGEWALALFYILFFFTFIREFQKIYVQLSSRILVRHFDEQASLTMSYEAEEERRPILNC